MIKRLAANQHIKNVSWNLADAILYPIALLVATPVYLKELGTELYGLWTLLTSIIISIGVLNGGLGDTSIKFISKYRALKNFEGAKKIFRTTYSITLFIVFCIILVSPFLAKGIIWLKVFEIPARLEEKTELYLLLSFVSLSLKLIEQIFFSYFKAYEEYNIFSIASMGVRIGGILLNILLLLLGYGLVAVLVSSICISFFFLAPLAIKIAKRESLQALLPTYDRETISEIWDFSKWSWLQTIIGVFNSQVDKMLVASLVSLQALTYYSLGLMVVNQIHMVLSTATSIIAPRVSQKVELQENTSALFATLQFLVTIVGLLVIFHLNVCKDFIFPLWIGQEVFSQAQPLFLLFFGYQALASTTVVPYFYLVGSGKIKENAVNQLATTVLMLLAMFLLFLEMGENGLVVGKTVALLFSTSVFFLYLKKKVMPQLPWFTFYKSLALALLGYAVLVVESLYADIAFVFYLYYLFFQFAKNQNFLKKLAPKA